jgi:hypothetical protein
VFIPDKAHKPNLSPHQHKVCSPIWNISHIVSSLLHCGLQRNDQHRTHSQRLVPHLLPSNRQRKKQLGPEVSFRIWWSVRLSWIRQTLLFRLFEGPRRAFEADRLVLDLVACFIFSFWVLSINICKVNSLFSLLFHHKDLGLGSGLAQDWYLKIGEPQQKWTAKN